MKRLVVMTTILMLLTLGTPVVLRSTSSLAEIEQAKHYQLPRGDWTLACIPTLKPNPIVDVYVLSTEASKGFTITKVEIRNQSGKPVAALKLRWRLCLRNSPDATLLGGETPSLDISLLPNHRRSLKYPVVCFADIVGPLAKEGRLNGDFIIEVGVADITFEKTAWLNPENGAKRYSVKPVSWQIGDICDTGDCASTGGCQSQNCVWSQASNCWVCSYSANLTCSVISCDSCNVGRCR